MKNKFLFSVMLALLAFGLTLTSCFRYGRSPEEMKAIALVNEAAALKALNSDFSVGAVKVEGASLQKKLEWLKGNAKSGGNYILEINADEQICGSKGNVCYLSFKDSNITITLRGIEANRTISIGEAGNIFTVDSGITLILDDNITLKGLSTKSNTGSTALVAIRSGGTFIMNDGSTITGNLSLPYIYLAGGGGGVEVYDGGTFIMKGGTITRNRVSRPLEANFDASTKKQIAYKLECGHGGGVYVRRDVRGGSGTFIKIGGTITGYSSDPSNGNAVVTPDGNEIINGCGHAVFFDGKPIAIDTTVGSEITLNFINDVFSEGRNEPKPQAAIPDNNNQESSVNGSPEIQETVQQVPQQVPPPQTAVTPQEALQEYQATMQKMQAMQREAQQEYQATIQKNPAAAQEAAQKYQKTLQEAQREVQEAAKKYQEALQKGR